MEESEAQKYLKKMELLESERTQWDTRNQDITDFQMPGRGKYMSAGAKANRGEDREDEIVNESSALASRITVAGMIWGLSSPASEWFQIGLIDKDLQKYAPVKEYLQFYQKGLRSVFHRSNFYTAIYPVYEEQVGFGTGVMLAEEDYETLVRYRVMTAGEYVLATDERGLVDTLGRRFHMTARQMVTRFGEGKVSDAVKRKNDTNPYEWFEIVHFIEPNTDRNDRRIDNQNMEYTSIYVDVQSKTPLRKSGYEEKPMFCPRWSVIAQEVYGRGIGNLMLGSSMELQEMEKSSLAALYKLIDPPMVGPAEFVQNVDVSAGAANPSPPGAKIDQFKPLYQISFDIKNVQAKIKEIEGRISRGYFNDLFLFIMSNPNATATEILEKKAEKVILLGPVVTRQQNELFTPCIDRTLGIMQRAGFFPPPPEELEDQPLEIEYISQLAIAQKIASTDGIYSYLAFVKNAAELNPDAADKANTDEAVDEMADLLGVPPKLNRGRDEVAAIRDARSEREMKQQQTLDAMTALQGAEQLSRTDTEGKNALTDLLGQGGAA